MTLTTNSCGCPPKPGGLGLFSFNVGGGGYQQTSPYAYNAGMSFNNDWLTGGGTAVPSAPQTSEEAVVFERYINPALDAISEGVNIINMLRSGQPDGQPGSQPGGPYGGQAPQSAGAGRYVVPGVLLAGVGLAAFSLARAMSKQKEGDDD